MGYLEQAAEADRLWREQGHTAADETVILAVDPGVDQTAIVWIKVGDGVAEPILDLSYPKPLPPHPGPRPPWWKRRARRDWSDKVTARNKIKRINFGFLYGRGKEGLNASD